VNRRRRSWSGCLGASPAFLRPNGRPHHIRHAKPHARHLLPGLDPHRRPLPPDRRHCRPSSIAANQSTPPCLPCSNQLPPHLPCHMPTSKHLFSGPFRRHGRPSPERLARSRLPPWPGGHRPTLPEPRPSSGAPRCAGAHAALGRRRRRPPRRSREPGPLPCFRRSAIKTDAIPIPSLCISLCVHDRWAQPGSWSHVTVEVVVSLDMLSGTSSRSS
jgi:hypothetical protein